MQQMTPNQLGSQPATPRKERQFTWKLGRGYQQSSGGKGGDRVPLVLPYLDNLNLPFVDDSNAVTPTSEELYCIQDAGGIRYIAVQVCIVIILIYNILFLFFTKMYMFSC